MNRWLVLASVVLPAAAAAQAVNFQELEHARAFGMGGAYRGTGLGADSMEGNPASMGTIKTFQSEMSGTYDTRSKDGYGAAMVRDTATSDVGAGVGYHFVAVGGDAHRSFANLSTLAVSAPLFDAVVIGAAAHYLYMSGAQNISAGTFDAGVIVRPTGGLMLGISANNIIDTGHAILARYYTANFAFLAGTFSIAADVRSNLRKDTGRPLLNVGGEYFIGQVVFIRAGFSHDFFTYRNTVSGGFGVFTQGGGVDIAYRHEFAGANSRMLVLTLRMQL
jgi:hypothetical protein